MRNILAFDTAMSACSAGVYRAQDQKIFSKIVPLERGQGERLMPLIGEVLEEAGFGYEQIGALVTTLGPGAFTGLRIGMAAAKGMALALDIPLLGISNLHALALQYAHKKKPDRNLAVLIETRREDFYFQLFSNEGIALSDPAALAADEIRKQTAECILIGDGVARFSGKAEGPAVPDAGYIAALLARQGEGQIFTYAIEPLYLRPADTTSPKKPARVLLSEF
ncbi:MAG: tRNA (adenosine(37)-N6)-threonylcarbamoyltransferase complex dimerization subunit type 1 TsaB [Alphaproteobacteria bacterium]|nr:tRNA (adenosine(37)-N6)-threonylcarbamoyltransferase complex dimerization subunit type 1 TsaB [Alphaproteobacteria bacterium]